MRIGEAALAAGCQTETVRYYERAGLLPKTARTLGNYRQYTVDDVERLVFVRHARSLDMTLDEIRALLDVRDAPEKNCGAVNALIDEHIRHITERIAVLGALRQQLQALRSQCQQAQAAKDCGILHQLGHAEPPITQSAGPMCASGEHFLRDTASNPMKGRRAPTARRSRSSNSAQT